MTHIDNIPIVENCGLVNAASPLRSTNYVSIGDVRVIEQRANREVKGYRLSEYIPFYLGPRTPMLYVIQHGYNGVKRIDAEQIVYCVIRLDDIVESEKECIFTDGHALNRLTNFYGNNFLSKISEIVRFDDVFSANWISKTDPDLKRRKEAELLIKNDLEPRFVRGYIVHSVMAGSKLESLGIDKTKIVVRPDYYF